MPKSQFIDQKTVRKSGWIKYQDTPVNQYKKTIEEEKANYTKEEFLRIYRELLRLSFVFSFLALIFSKTVPNIIETVIIPPAIPSPI